MRWIVGCFLSRPGLNQYGDFVIEVSSRVSQVKCYVCFTVSALHKIHSLITNPLEVDPEVERVSENRKWVAMCLRGSH